MKLYFLYILIVFENYDFFDKFSNGIAISLRNQEDGLVVLAEELRVQADAKHVILKLGAEGTLLHMWGDGEVSNTDRLPALNSSPRDVTGTGDSLLISSAMAIAVGATPWIAAYVGSIAAAIQVSRVGNVPLTQTDLTNEVTQ